MRKLGNAFPTVFSVSPQPLRDLCDSTEYGVEFKLFTHDNKEP
jgi:hypothetical protein